MRNELLSIGPVTISIFGIMVAIGVLACFTLVDYRAKKQGLDDDLIFYVGTASLFAGLLSSKLLYVILDMPNIIRSGAYLSAFIGPGYVVYGGLIGGVLTGLLLLKIKKAPFLPYFDLAAPSIIIAQAFGRLGCLVAGCCYGFTTDTRFGIIYENSKLAPNNVRLFPTQILSSLGNFVIFFILLWYAKQKPKTGRVGALYIILYAVGRFMVEYLRNDRRGEVGFLSLSQFISIVMLIPGIWLFMRAKEAKTNSI